MYNRLRPNTNAAIGLADGHRSKHTREQVVRAIRNNSGVIE